MTPTACSGPDFCSVPSTATVSVTIKLRRRACAVIERAKSLRIDNGNMADKPGWVVPMFATRIEAVEFRKSMLLLGVEVIRDPWVARGAQSRIREVLLLREYF